jgi:AAA domain
MSDYFDLYKQYCITEDKNLVEGITFKEGKAWSDPFICILPNHAGDRNGKHASINRLTGAYNCLTHCHKRSMADIIAIFTNVDINEAWGTVNSFRENNKKEIVLDDVSGISKFLPTRNPHFERLYKLSQENLSPDILEVREYLWSRKITFETMQKLGIGWLPETETVWHRDSLVFPYFADGKVIGLRYRDAGTSKSYETGSYVYPWGLDMLDENPTNPVVIITEGESDRCTTWQALNGEYPVISIPGSHFQSAWKRELTGIGNLIFLMQDDDASKNLAKSIESSYKDLKVIQLPWKRGQIYGKDVADWLRYNTPEDLRKLLETKVDLRKKGFITGEEFKEMANYDEEWIIENLLSKKNLLCIGGFAKAKKTICSINMLKSLLTGQNFLGLEDYKVVKPEEGYKILFIEEEGSDRELCGRLNSIFGEDGDWTKNTFWSYSNGVSVDKDVWVDYIIDFCKINKIDIIMLDPFTRLHSADENSAKEMQVVFGNIAKIKREIDNLSIILLHHFTKSGTIESGLRAWRGSSVFPGELDMSILMECIENTGDRGVKIKFTGRKKPPTYKNGKEYFCAQLNDDLTLTIVDEETLHNTSENKFNLDQMPEYIRGAKSISVPDLARNYNVAPEAIIAHVKANSGTYRLVGSSSSKDTMRVLLK